MSKCDTQPPPEPQPQPCEQSAQGTNGAGSPERSEDPGVEEPQPMQPTPPSSYVRHGPPIVWNTMYPGHFGGPRPIMPGIMVPPFHVHRRLLAHQHGQMLPMAPHPMAYHGFVAPHPPMYPDYCYASPAGGDAGACVAPSHKVMSKPVEREEPTAEDAGQGAEAPPAATAASEVGSSPLAKCNVVIMSESPPDSSDSDVILDTDVVESIWTSENAYESPPANFSPTTAPQSHGDSTGAAAESLPTSDATGSTTQTPGGENGTEWPCPPECATPETHHPPAPEFVHQEQEAPAPHCMHQEQEAPAPHCMHQEQEAPAPQYTHQEQEVPAPHYYGEDAQPPAYRYSPEQHVATETDAYPPPPYDAHHGADISLYNHADDNLVMQNHGYNTQYTSQAAVEISQEEVHMEEQIDMSLNQESNATHETTNFNSESTLTTPSKSKRSEKGSLISSLLAPLRGTKRRTSTSSPIVHDGENAINNPEQVEAMFAMEEVLPQLSTSNGHSKVRHARSSGAGTASVDATANDTAAAKSSRKVAPLPPIHSKKKDPASAAVTTEAVRASRIE